MLNDFPGIDFEVVDGLAWITLNKPDRGNAFTYQMQQDLATIWTEVRDDPTIRVAAVTGSGERFFCTGVDVKETAENGRLKAGKGSAAREVVLTPRQHEVWKPVICAVNGLCVGGGLHFVAEADIVVAADHAAFMDAHVDVGMVGAVENIGLAHRMPLGSVLRMTLMGRHYRMPADRAYQVGLVDEVVPLSELRDTVTDMARLMMTNSPTAMALSQQAVWGSLGRPYADAIEYGWALLRMHWGHPDFREGSRAFAEGRPPQWLDDPNASIGDARHE